MRTKTDSDGQVYDCFAGDPSSRPIEFERGPRDVARLESLKADYLAYRMATEAKGLKPVSLENFMKANQKEQQ